MKSRILLAAAALLLASAATAHTPPGDLMQKKTARAQNILRSLAMADLAAVKAEADSLEAITVAAGFEDKSDTYAAYGKEFLRLVRELGREAARKNLAGSYYQFTRMTSVCFSCHEHIRDEKK
jgi:hypothetical protein